MNRIDYSIRKSKRARRVILRVNLRGLTVVVPHRHRISRSEIQSIVEQSQPWIRKAMARFDNTNAQIPEQTGPDFQNTIHFLPGHLAGKSDPDSIKECKHFLYRQVKQPLITFAESVIKDTARIVPGLEPAGIKITKAKSRWGSCNARRTICLSYRTALLPERLARHVILHEMAHLKHLDHSRQFYSLLAKLDPEHRKHSKELDKAGRGLLYLS